MYQVVRSGLQKSEFKFLLPPKLARPLISLTFCPPMLLYVVSHRNSKGTKFASDAHKYLASNTHEYFVPSYID